MEYIPAKTLIGRTKDSSWFGTSYTMNIYKGCSHGCIYCDSRSDCYCISDFDTVHAKQNALGLIRDELRRKAQTGVIGTGSMSDPYNPFEKKLLLTRHALELIDTYEFGVSIATKSPLMTRDIDLIQSIQSHSPVICKITITTPDDTLAKKIEPYVAPSTKRFEAVKLLSGAGIFTGLLLMPVLPFITDEPDPILELIHLAKANGARFIYPAFGMTLRSGQRNYYYEKLDELFPGTKEQYIKRYGDFYRCTSPHARKLYTLFANECDKLGILYKMPQIISASKEGHMPRQLSLF